MNHDSQRGTTANREDLAIHPPAVFAAQECNNVRNVLWQAGAFQRGPTGSDLMIVLVKRGQAWGGNSSSADLIDFFIGHGCTVWDVLTCNFFVHVGFDTAWGDGIDGYFLAAKV